MGVLRAWLGAGTFSQSIFPSDELTASRPWEVLHSAGSSSAGWGVVWVGLCHGRSRKEHVGGSVCRRT